MVFGFAEWIWFLLAYRAGLVLYTTDSARQVALIRPGLSRATFPPGEGFEWCRLS